MQGQPIDRRRAPLAPPRGVRGKLALLRAQGERLRAAGELAGWPRLAWAAPLWLVVRRYRIIVWSTAGGSLPHRGFPATIRRHRVCSETIGMMTALNPRWSRRLVGGRLLAGHQGHVWIDRGRPVHARWLTSARAHLPYLGIDFQPRPGDLLSIEAYTAPDRRHQGLYAAGLGWLLAEARREGFRRCVLAAAWWNRPILGLFERLGARPVGEIDSWRLGPLRHHRVRGLVRRGEGSTVWVEGRAAAPSAGPDALVQPID